MTGINQLQENSYKKSFFSSLLRLLAPFRSQPRPQDSRPRIAEFKCENHGVRQVERGGIRIASLIACLGIKIDKRCEIARRMSGEQAVVKRGHSAA